MKTWKKINLDTFSDVTTAVAKLKYFIITTCAIRNTKVFSVKNG